MPHTTNEQPPAALASTVQPAQQPQQPRPNDVRPSRPIMDDEGLDVFMRHYNVLKELADR